MSNIGAFPQFSHSGSPSSPTSRRILNSWKEIAAYVGRGVRTVQRYEERLRFPVHRPAARKHSSVLAFSDEIELWLRSTPAQTQSSATDADPESPANLAFTNSVNDELERAKEETETGASMDSETLLGKCPVCGNGPVTRLTIGYRILALKPNQTQPIGGLLAYQCAVEGHVFFVLARDVEEALAS